MRTVVCCGEGWATGWAAFVADGCEWEGVERPALFACAQETEHWQKMPRERRADKHVADFTALRLSGKLRDLGATTISNETKPGHGPFERQNPEIGHNFLVSYPLFATPPWSIAFV
jgi:hypothetical protein